ncbi:hypothetical protein Misp04_53890 [Micromonospora sp. NBRC 101691]|nr:hypothetical protein Misp04_53890 [Micromonospora sp. NBRC 101691]
MARTGRPDVARPARPARIRVPTHRARTHRARTHRARTHRARTHRARTHRARTWRGPAPCPGWTGPDRVPDQAGRSALRRIQPIPSLAQLHDTETYHSSSLVL